MDCVACGSAAVTERPERTARGYRRFRCRECGKQYNERSGTLLNHAQYPSDVIALVVLWRPRYRLSQMEWVLPLLSRLGCSWKRGGFPWSGTTCSTTGAVQDRPSRLDRKIRPRPGAARPASILNNACTAPGFLDNRLDYAA